MANEGTLRGPRRLASALLVGLCFTPAARAEAPPLEERIDRATVVRLAAERSPDVRAEAARARSMSAEGEAESALPPPEVMTQIWQVPLARPYSIQDAQMIMLGVGQTFPAPGARAARAAAKRASARAGEATGAGRGREASRDAEHAFADYVEAVAHHRIHKEHREVARRTLGVARARYAASGALTDLTQAELELARVSADVVTDAARTETARARINTLLLRAPGAALGQPVVEEPAVAVASVTELLAESIRARPELRAAEATRSARGEELHASEQEASWPSFSVAALYFAPTTSLPINSYGMNATMTLPWLWGGPSKRREASREAVAAAAADVDGTRLRVTNEVATASASVRAAGLRLQVVRDRVLPVSERAFQAAWTGYESGRADILTLLAAEGAVVDAREAIVMARSTLDHALADLDAAVGAPVARRPLGPMTDDDAEVTHGH